MRTHDCAEVYIMVIVLAVSSVSYRTFLREEINFAAIIEFAVLSHLESMHLFLV